MQRLAREWRNLARRLRARGFFAAAATKESDTAELEKLLRGDAAAMRK